MQKRRARFLFLCVAVVFIFGFAGDVPAFDWFDEKVRLHGFIRNQTGVRLKDHYFYDPIVDQTPGVPRLENMKQQAGKLSTCRTTLQLEGEWDITPDLMLSVAARVFYDAKWDLDHDINVYGGRGYDDVMTYNPVPLGGTPVRGLDLGNTAHGLKTEPYGEKKEFDYDFREYYLNYVVGDFRIKIGRQQIAWGEADAIRVADTINPLDFTVDFTTTAYGMDWEDVRIPLRMIDLIYVVPDSRYQYEIELVANFEDFRGHTKADAYGETFYLFPQQTGFSYTPFSILAPGYMGVYQDPPHTASSMWSAFTDNVLEAADDADNTFQGGVRLRGVFGGWDTHVFYYYQRFQDPLFSSKSVFNCFPVPLPWDWNTFDLGFEAEYPRIQTVGGTFNSFFDPWGTVFRGEFATVIDEPFSALNQGRMTSEQYYSGDYIVPAVGRPEIWRQNKFWGEWFHHEVVKKTTVHGMLGFDRPTWIPFLNPTTTFFITGQFYYKKIINYDDDAGGESIDSGDYRLDTMMGRNSQSDHKYLTSLKINTKYMDDTIEPDVLVVWDINGHSGFVKPCIAWKPTYDWRLELGALYLWADGPKNGPFGYVKDSDLIYGVIEYKF